MSWWLLPDPVKMDASKPPSMSAALTANAGPDKGVIVKNYAFAAPAIAAVATTAAAIMLFFIALTPLSESTRLGCL